MLDGRMINPFHPVCEVFNNVLIQDTGSAVDTGTVAENVKRGRGFRPWPGFLKWGPSPVCPLDDTSHAGDDRRKQPGRIGQGRCF